jgi:hypothetical protein
MRLRLQSNQMRMQRQAPNSELSYFGGNDKFLPKYQTIGIHMDAYRSVKECGLMWQMWEIRYI